MCIKTDSAADFQRRNGRRAQSDGALSWNMHRALLYWGKKEYMCVMQLSRTSDTTRALIQLHMIYRISWQSNSTSLYGCTKLLPRPISKDCVEFYFHCDHFDSLLCYFPSRARTAVLVYTRAGVQIQILAFKSVFWESVCSYVCVSKNVSLKFPQALARVGNFK
jgi:hypothetical protein